jgi:LacI family transcriptional regulator
MHEEIKEAGEKFKPPYFVIAEGIVKDIEEGNYKTGERLPSSKEFSLLYKVNKSTVKRAFELLKLKNILKTVQGVGMVVAKKPEPDTVVVIVPKALYKLDELLAGAKEVCQQHKTKIEVREYSSQDEQEEIIFSLADKEYKGAIIHPAFSDEIQEELNRLREKVEFPIALLGRADQDDARCWRVERCEFKAGYMAAEHLIQQNFFRIGIVISRNSYDLAFLNGYSQALHEYESLIRDPYIQYVEDEDAPGDATRELLSIDKRPPKAIIYTHSEDALAGLSVMKARGIVPGKEMGVVCFGDFPEAEKNEPAITVVKNDENEVGRKAANLIFWYLSVNLGRQRFESEKVGLEVRIRPSSQKGNKGPICLSELQHQKRGLAMDRQRRTDRYLRDVYNPGWWKTEPLGWEREELYYRTLYNNW